MSSNSKVTSEHLRRRACLYIRQSSLHQVETNKESQFRQYNLRHRALALGWSEDQIDIIDEDQGKSGASTAQRTGFQDLRARVGAAEVGIILSLEVSRLCRDNAEWHQLLRIAAVSNTLILDEYGVYNVSDLNDWMLLGLKGQLSEYELRGIRERMVGGQRSKARRGELKLPLPIGLAYTATDEVVLDPDQSITEAVDLVFHTFRRLNSIMQVTKWFRKQGIRLPSRPRSVAGAVYWSVPNSSHLQRILHNPRYAGCYAYGRTKTEQRADGSIKYSRIPMDQWMVCIPEAHAGYISWEEYLQNQDTIRANATSFLRGDRVPSPRKGVALLQSRIICGLCGQRMQVSYNRDKRRASAPKWYYLCKENKVRHGMQTCQSMRGGVLDEAVGTFVVAAVNQENLALSLMVREQLRTDFETADRQRMNHIQALRHQVDLARRRFMEVDPSNRLVAATLEAEWEAQLKRHTEAVRERENYMDAQTSMPEPERDKRILELTHDFCKVWKAPETSNEDRKRLLGFLVEDITLTRNGYQVEVGLRLRGGRIHQLDPVALPLPRAVIIRRDASTKVLAELEILLEAGCSDGLAAKELNRRGHRDSRGDRFTRQSICIIRTRYNIKNGLRWKRDQLREQGCINGIELAAELGVAYSHLHRYVPDNPRVEIYEIPSEKRTFKMYKLIPEPQDKQVS